MQWVSCASSRLTVWLQGLKVRDLSSTPVSRAILETSCSGIRLQTWRKRLNRQRVGLIVFFFFIPAVWQVQNVKPTLFFIFCGMAVHGFLFPLSVLSVSSVVKKRPSGNELQPEGGEGRHAQQEQAMAPALNVRLAIGAGLVADRQIDDPQVQLRRAEQEVKIAKRIKVAKVSAVARDGFVILFEKHL